MSRDRRRKLMDWILDSESFATALEVLDQAVARKLEGLAKVQADLSAARIHADAVDADFEDLPVQDASGTRDLVAKSRSDGALSPRARGEGRRNVRGPDKKFPCPSCGELVTKRGRQSHEAQDHDGKPQEWPT